MQPLIPRDSKRWRDLYRVVRRSKESSAYSSIGSGWPLSAFAGWLAFSFTLI
jgi:cobalamin biosynthesis protein CobD/CbiB